jgi:hypothetical protein
MRKLTLFLFALCAAALSSYAQTATLRYNPPATASCTVTGCVVSLTSKPIIAGDTLAYQCSTNSFSVTVITAVANGGTLHILPATSEHSSSILSQAYILSANAETGSETITLSTGESGSFTGASCTIWDYYPTGGTLQFDGDNGNQNQNGSSVTSLTASLFTPSSGSAADTSVQEVSPTPSSISSPFTIVNGSFAFLNNTTSTQNPTWTFGSSTGEAVAQQLWFGFNTTPCTDWSFNNFSGTPGAAVTLAQVNATAQGFLQGGWVFGGSGSNSTAFTYGSGSPASQPLVGTLSRACDGSFISDSSTTGIVYSTNAGNDVKIVLGNNSYGVIYPGRVTEDVNISSTFPNTDTSLIDSYGIETSNVNDFTNAMLAQGTCGPSSGSTSYQCLNQVSSDTTGRGVQMECGSQSNHGFYLLSPNTTYHFQTTINPGGVDYLNVYLGWQNPTSPGTLLTSISCASNGASYYPADAVIGNGQVSNVPTTGNSVYFDSMLMTYGGPLVCYAASPAEADVVAAINLCLAGGTVVIPAGSATWTTNEAFTVTGPLAIEGQTFCTGVACNPGSGLLCNSGTSASCLATSNFSDNSGSCTPTVGTCITLTGATNNTAVLSINGCSAVNLCQIADITFINNAGTSTWSIGINGTATQAYYRMHHLHVLNNSETFFRPGENGGLSDHILYSGVSDYSYSNIAGGTDRGYFYWNSPSPWGTYNAHFIEDSSFTFTCSGGGAGCTPGGVTDGNAGGSVTIRYNQITGGQGANFTHGYDSGPNRGFLLTEIYKNVMNTNASDHNNNHNVWASRGGAILFHDNVLGGTDPWRSVGLDYFRVEGQSNSAQVGTAQLGMNWMPLLTNPASGGAVEGTLNGSTSAAPAWTASHAYAANATIGPTGSSNTNNFNYITLTSCTSGSTQPTWNQTFNQLSNGAVTGGPYTPIDGTCTWYNVGGSTTNSGLGAGIAGWCAANPDTLASSNATCAALSAGDTASRYTDANGGNWPYRDQNCVIHNQVTGQCFQWNNSGSQLPSPVWASETNVAQLNRDFFNSAPSGYTPAGYPHPLQSASGSVTLSPSSESFGLFNVGSSSSPVTFTLTNGSSIAATSISISDTDSAEFPITNSGSGSCSSGSLAASASCTFTVPFSPTSAGLKSATLTVSYSGGDGASPQSAALSGTGVSVTAPAVAIFGMLR